MTTETATKPNTVLLALAKGFTDKVTKALRDEASPGVHHIEAQVSLSGDLAINDDLPFLESVTKHQRNTNDHFR